MANIRDIRRRIRSVKNTQQITKAMKMVSAAKLRRAQEAIVAARPYAHRMLRVLNSLATRVDRDKHPLLKERAEEKVEVVVVTADRGLCGAFNTSIVRMANQFLEKMAGDNKPVTVNLVGRKAVDHYKKRHYTITGRRVNIFQRVKPQDAQELAQDLIERYTAGELDAVYVVYNEFKSAISQKVIVERLLPIERLPEAEDMGQQEYITEPSEQEIFDTLLPKHVETQVFRAILESAAAEHGARMSAMDGATRNASEMIDALTLTANRTRQAAITKELNEIVGGANALEG